MLWRFSVCFPFRSHLASLQGIYCFLLLLSNGFMSKMLRTTLYLNNTCWSLFRPYINALVLLIVTSFWISSIMIGAIQVTGEVLVTCTTSSCCCMVQEEWNICNSPWQSNLLHVKTSATNNCQYLPCTCMVSQKIRFFSNDGINRIISHGNFVGSASSSAWIILRILIFHIHCMAVRLMRMVE